MVFGGAEAFRRRCPLGGGPRWTPGPRRVEEAPSNERHIRHREMLLVSQSEPPQNAGQDNDGCLGTCCGLYHVMIGRYLNRPRAVLFIFLCWVGVGIGFGMIDQHWSFVRSLYFSISSMSTAGLQAADCTGANGHIDSRRAVFVGFFCPARCPGGFEVLYLSGPILLTS